MSNPLTFDIEYNRKLSHNMLKGFRDNTAYNVEPRALTTLKPLNSIERNGKYFMQYGTVSSIPIYNDISLRKINRGDSNLRKVTIQPAKKRGRPKKVTKNEVDDALDGGGIKSLAKKAAKKTKKAATSKVGRKIIGTALDVGVPALGTAIGTLGSQPVLGALSGKVAREGIRATTGFGAMHKAAVVKAKLGAIGRDKKVVELSKKAVGKALDIGLPVLGEIAAEHFDVSPEIGKQIGKLARKGVKQISGLGGPKGKRGDSTFGAKMARRRVLVNKIMKSEGLSHKAASALVKSKNMKY